MIQWASSKFASHVVIGLYGLATIWNFSAVAGAAPVIVIIRPQGTAVSASPVAAAVNASPEGVLS
jgi:hypothetical protein